MLRRGRRHLLLAAVLLASLPAGSTAHERDTALRLLNAEEGLAIVSTVWEHRQQIRSKPDFSHLVHQVYELAGFPYPYASSFELYGGVDNFRRVQAPHPGDLVVWRGHVGIVINPVRHSFYSSVRSGLRVEYYDEAYWRERGRPRFYRYVREDAGTSVAADISPTSKVSESLLVSVPVRGENATTRTPRTTSPARPKREPRAATPTLPVEHSLEVPSSILVAAASDRPTEDEIGEAVSELNSATSNILRDATLARAARMVLIYDQLSIERLDIKRDRGWLYMQIEGNVSIVGEKLESKHRREKLRWELRRTAQGWQLLARPDRAYVPRDVAARVLADQLALLTQNEGASDVLVQSLREEKRIVRALGLLFAGN